MRLAHRRRGQLIAMACAMLACLGALGAQQPAAPDPNRWESAIQKFEEADTLNPPATGGIVFFGASSIVRWNLDESFPDLKGTTANRGFGGSEMADAARYAARVVLPRAPRVVVLYPGENDVARGVKADAIGAGFQQFYTTVHTALPQTRVVVIGLKPTPVRWQFDDEMQRANVLLEGYCKAQANCVYVDVRPDMMGADGKPRPELYVADGEHMTAEGYKIWTRLVRATLESKK
jgi:lysophospholipase L1-like esterase